MMYSSKTNNITKKVPRHVVPRFGKMSYSTCFELTTSSSGVFANVRDWTHKAPF